MLDGRPFIRVDNTMPEHPKVVGISDGAFRTLVTLWCYCSRNYTDGIVPAPVIAMHKRTHINDLEKAGLLEYRGGDYYCHDYAEHQQTASEAATMMATKKARGSFGAHRRWHVNKGRFEPKCPLCNPVPDDA